MLLKIAEQDAHETWIKGLAIGSPVMVGRHDRDGWYAAGTVVKVSPTGQLTVKVPTDLQHIPDPRFMPDGKEIGGRYGCNIWQPCERIDAQNADVWSFNRVINRARKTDGTVKKWARNAAPAERERMSAILLLIQNMIDGKPSKTPTRGLCSPCRDLLRAADVDLPPES